MEESKRQKQVARLVQEEMALLFQKEGLNMVDGGNAFCFAGSGNAGFIGSTRIFEFL